MIYVFMVVVLVIMMLWLRPHTKEAVHTPTSDGFSQVSPQANGSSNTKHVPIEPSSLSEEPYSSSESNLSKHKKTTMTDNVNAALDDEHQIFIEEDIETTDLANPRVMELTALAPFATANNPVLIEHIAPIFFEHGQAFEMDWEQIQHLPPGQQVTITLPEQQETHMGEVTQHYRSAGNISHIRIDFDEDSDGGYVKLSQLSSGRIKGQWYSSNGNYQFWAYDNVGFLLSQHLLHTLNGSPRGH